ncbi:hypothetical protein AB0H87_31005, partial [Asanoa sp. NPDC050611]
MTDADRGHAANQRGPGTPQDTRGRPPGAGARGVGQRLQDRRCWRKPVHQPAGKGKGDRVMVPPADFRSYYGRPVIK